MSGPVNIRSAYDVVLSTQTSAARRDVMIYSCNVDWLCSGSVKCVVTDHSKTTTSVQTDNSSLLSLRRRWNGCRSPVSIFSSVLVKLLFLKYFCIIAWVTNSLDSNAVNSWLTALCCVACACPCGSSAHWSVGPTHFLLGRDKALMAGFGFI